MAMCQTVVSFYEELLCILLEDLCASSLDLLDLLVGRKSDMSPHALLKLSFFGLRFSSGNVCLEKRILLAINSY